MCPSGPTYSVYVVQLPLTVLCTIGHQTTLMAATLDGPACLIQAECGMREIWNPEIVVEVKRIVESQTDTLFRDQRNTQRYIKVVGRHTTNVGLSRLNAILLCRHD